MRATVGRRDLSRDRGCAACPGQILGCPRTGERGGRGARRKAQGARRKARRTPRAHRRRRKRKRERRGCPRSASEKGARVLDRVKTAANRRKAGDWLLARERSQVLTRSCARGRGARASRRGRERFECSISMA